MDVYVELAMGGSFLQTHQSAVYVHVESLVLGCIYVHSTLLNVMLQRANVELRDLHVQYTALYRHYEAEQSLQRRYEDYGDKLLREEKHDHENSESGELSETRTRKKYPKPLPPFPSTISRTKISPHFSSFRHSRYMCEI